MAKDFIRAEGVVLTVLPNSSFKVEITDNKQVIIASIAGKLRKKRRIVKIVEGDRVSLEISPYDLEKGRIVYRF